MIRVLVMIAVTGFFVSLVTLSTAVALGGPTLLEHAAWGWGSDHWKIGSWNFGRDWDGYGIHQHDGGEDRRTTGPTITKDFPWEGGDRLEIAVPADVQYTQGAAGKITVTGSERALRDLDVQGGRIQFDNRRTYRHSGDLTIVITAPGVTHFELAGSGQLAISGYKQDRLDLNITGSGSVRAAGETRDAAIDVKGSGDADLSDVKVRTARIGIHGSGAAKVAPVDSADVDISGSGDVTLLSRPQKLESHISGSGSLHQDAPGATTTAPEPPPAPPRTGKKA